MIEAIEGGARKKRRVEEEAVVEEGIRWEEINEMEDLCEEEKEERREVLAAWELGGEKDDNEGICSGAGHRAKDQLTRTSATCSRSANL